MMTDLLQASIDAVAVPGILLAHRLIVDGDEAALLPEEAAAFAGSVAKVRRASGAVRIAARQLLARFGRHEQAVPRSPSGPPVWPDGIVGSLAHDSEVAIAALALRRDFSGVGVDVEPAERLDPDLLHMIVSAREQDRIRDNPLGGRLLFAVKEAVYKAVYPLDGMFLDHHDVEVDLAARIATIRHGRTVAFRYGLTPRIVTLAFIPAP